MAARLGEPYVVDRYAIGDQAGGEVAHGREEYRDALLVTPYVGCLASCFYHEHPIELRVKAVKSKAVAVELIAQYQYELTRRTHGATMRGGSCRSPCPLLR